MKRRSARPFVVEVKTPSRTSRTTLHDGPGAARIEGGLWRGMLANTPTMPEAKPAAACVAPSSDVSRTPATMAAPIARRILPNLLPLVAPDADIAEPVIRRRGPNQRPRAATVSSPIALVSVPASPPVPTIAAVPLPVPETDFTVTGPVASFPTAGPRSGPKPTPRRADNLRPGERWKRRLSRFAR